MKNISFKLWFVSLVAIFCSSCGKSGDNNANPTPAVNTGAFSSNTTTYTGSCQSAPDVGTGGSVGNIDASIITTSGVSFFIYNMPQGSSGNYNFTNGDNTVGGSQLYGIFVSSSSVQYTTTSGSVTKTGANSFTFSCVVYDIVSNTSLNVTGKGTY